MKEKRESEFEFFAIKQSLFENNRYTSIKYNMLKYNCVCIVSIVLRISKLNRLSSLYKYKCNNTYIGNLNP